jgi:hypothetical protein
MIEQTVKMADLDTLIEHQNYVHERVISPEDAIIRMNIDNITYQPDQFSKMTPLQRLRMKSMLTREFNKEIRTIQQRIGQEEECFSYMSTLKELESMNEICTRNSLSSNKVSYYSGNFKLMQTFSLNNWRVIEMIVQDKIEVEDLSFDTLKELMMVILPNGQTLVSLLIKNINFRQLENLRFQIEKFNKTEES